MIISRGDRYNKKHIDEFDRKGAAKKFLDPIGLYYKPITADFAKDNSSCSDDEQMYFKAFHFVKFRLHKAQVEGSKRVKFWYQMFTMLRNRLVLGNMGLVYECIRKSPYATYQDNAEFVSAGSLTLIRAVECFDPWMGHRFSTYACRAILYRYSQVTSPNRPPALDVTEVDAPDESLETDSNVEFLIDRLMVAVEHSGLKDREKDVIMMRFSEGLKLAEIGDYYDVTKERVRQIQEIALTKIRVTLMKDKTLNSRNRVILNRLNQL